MIGTTAAIVASSIAAGGAVASSAIASNAAKNAAKEQAKATGEAADKMDAASKAALDEQKRQFNIEQANLQPWLQSGTQGLSALNWALGVGTNQAPAAGATNPYSALDPLRSGDPQKLAELQALQSKLPQQIADMEARIAELNARQDTSGHGFLGNFLGDTVTETQRRALEAQLAGAKAQLSSIPSEIASMYGMTPEQYQEALAAQQAQPQDGAAGADGTFQGTGLQYGDLMKPFEYDPEQDPSTQFRFGLGQDALNRSAASKGMPFGGSAAKAAIEYGQNFASQEYQGAWARNQSEKADTFNRLAALAGVGQQAVAQSGALSQNYANNAANIHISTGQSLADLATQAGNARASSIMGSGNAWAGAINGATNSILDLYLMNQLGKPVAASQPQSFVPAASLKPLNF